MTRVSRRKASVAVIVQARMGSSRLPGKVLIDLGPGSALDLLSRRLARLTEAAEVVIATSMVHEDDPIADWAARAALPVVRGSLEDVLDRYRLAAARVPCEGIVRITADCPLSAPEVVDRLIRLWRSDERLAYVWNTREPRSFPDGLDAEVISRSALEDAASEADDPYDREHVTPFLRARPDRFPQGALSLRPPVRDLKLSLDTEDDLATIREFVSRVGPDADFRRILAALHGDASHMVVA
jgi:spore coat polysaccharide biosynthesis protein SpsF (cytidylyltransferase family)